jgi:2-oxo-4-hydroxy-4-carboxy-5-ureidoimidazoline decarboxylase
MRPVRFILWLLVAQMALAINENGCAGKDDQTCQANDTNDTNNNKIKIRHLWDTGPTATALFLSGIYEHSAWVAEALVKLPEYKNIATVTELAATMKTIVDEATDKQKMDLLLAHPDLAQKIENISDLTPDSQQEQSSAGLQTMTKTERDKFTLWNNRYKEKFHIPFILAVRHSTKYTVLTALEGRLSNSKETEIVIAMQQVHKIAWMRLLSKVESNEPTGFLTCHVLDTANGCPGLYKNCST